PWAQIPTPPSPATAVTPALTSSDRKSTRLNSSHVEISYAVFCLKKTQRDAPASALPRFRAPLCGPHLRRRLSLQQGFFFLISRGPRGSPPFPHPTLFR